MADFDVVVVGGGSAGCVVAGRLCQTTNLKVCLVEAGPDYGPASSGRWPTELLDPRQQPATHDWGYTEERSDGSIIAESSAKVIGGCSTHNQCAAIWGVPDDYDRWAAAGNPGWSYAELAPLIDQIEQASPDQATSYRGRHGAVPTKPYGDGDLSTWQRSFLQSAVSAGFPRVIDLSAPEPAQGVAPFHVNVRGATRWNAAFAFLDPVRGRPNLTILEATVVDRLLIDQEEATELICRSGTGIIELRAKMFVLAAGTYGSPAILMRSGIGPAAHLDELGIPVQIDAPGVGQNLHDHPGVHVRFSPTPDVRRAVQEELAHARLFQSQVILKAASSQCAAGFDLHLLPYQEVTEAGEWEFVTLAFNMVPRSRGEVLLRGEDAELPPRIAFQFLTDPDDRDIAILLDGLHLARRLAETGPLASAVEWEVDPGQRIRSEADLRTYIRGTVTSYAHPVGTCKMGPLSDPMAVVDASGRVQGTSNVFVADASIMPQIPRANTNLTCLLIGMRMADVLRRLAE